MKKNNINKFQLSIFLLAIFLFSACKKETTTLSEVDLGYDYFPIELGTYLEYKADSIVYDDFTGTIDTLSFYIREEFTEIFQDQLDRETYRIERYTKQNLNDNWIGPVIWTANLTPERAERTEENIKYVKLTFPTREFNSWNGNDFNNLDTETYSYEYIGESEQIGDRVYEEVLKVQQAEIFNLLRNANYYEKYALGFGLVERTFIDVQTEIDGTIRSGSQYSQILIDKGTL